MPTQLPLKLQFSVIRPNDPDFSPDFDKAVIGLEEYQRAISETTDRRFFLLKEEANAMRMNFGLFDPKSDGIDLSREGESLIYKVDRQYETFWSDAKENHYCSIMPVFDTNDARISPERFAEKLVGAMCEITFTLKHYIIKPTTKIGTTVTAPYDTFSAHVEAVVLLTKAPVLVPSPYKGRLTKRPVHRPQLPIRKEQITAAEAFVPRPDFADGQNTTIGSETPSTPLSTSSLLTLSSESLDSDPFPPIAGLSNLSFPLVSSQCSSTSMTTIASDPDKEAVPVDAHLEKKRKIVK